MSRVDGQFAALFAHPDGRAEVERFWLVGEAPTVENLRDIGLFYRYFDAGWHVVVVVECATRD